ncbi:hypothetical protein PAUR_a2743 [Pseudoalteromonas aurantia 208]|uniref:Uncharacterized protein n=1 Tax=Pseudoalteromonas aurantia 208 TaxID=1314867 RepID=A0ABR9EDU2_9GAMM|nr:hypothetical protein [Pseudoalteromonas aurantia 208]
MFAVNTSFFAFFCFSLSALEDVFMIYQYVLDGFNFYFGIYYCI